MARGQVTYTDAGEVMCEWTIWDAAEALCGPQPTPHGNSRLDDWERRIWTGSSLEECQRLVREGWPIGAAQLDVGDSASRIEEVPDFKYDLGVEGVDVDVSAYLAGDPECMGDVRWLPTPKQLVRIGVDAAIDHTKKSEDLLAAGRSVFMMVEALRSRGYPTEVYVEWRSAATGYGRIGARRDIRTITVQIKIQSAEQPVHVAMLAYWLAHPSVFRRSIEALVETLPIDVRRTFGFVAGGSYGSPLPIRKDEYDEAAPSIQTHGLRGVQAWCEEVLSRR